MTKLLARTPLAFMLRGSDKSPQADAFWGQRDVRSVPPIF